MVTSRCCQFIFPAVALLVSTTLCGQVPPPPPTGAAATSGVEERAAQRVRQRVFQHLKARFPDLQVRAMLSFYREYGPDLFTEMQRKCACEPGEAEEYIRTLAEHFLEVDRVRKENPKEYERLLELEKLEFRARRLGRRIQALTAAGTTALERNAGGMLALARARRELAELLASCFDSEQENQQIEVNRLEAEVRELRRLLEERAANREIILEQRYFQLTGEEWPRDEHLKTAEAPLP